MDEQKKKLLGLLLSLTVQVVCLAVLEHQQQAEAQQSKSWASRPSSFTPQQMLIPALALWESVHTTATAYLSRLCVRSMFSDDEGKGELMDAAEHSFENGRVRSNRRRKRGFSMDGDRLANAVMTSSKALQVAIEEHMHRYNESQAQNCELDRLQRKERSDQLATVLGELAEVMSLIADRL